MSKKAVGQFLVNGALPSLPQMRGEGVELHSPLGLWGSAFDAMLHLIWSLEGLIVELRLRKRPHLVNRRGRLWAPPQMNCLRKTQLFPSSPRIKETQRIIQMQASLFAGLGGGGHPHYLPVIGPFHIQS